MASIINNLSRLHLGRSALDCECTWRMLQHFCGTFLDLSAYNCVYLPEHPITFLNLKILRLKMELDDILQLLPLLDAPTLQILDLRIFGFIDVEQLTIHLSKFPLLALCIASSESIDGLYRFFESPDIQAIPLVEVKPDYSLSRPKSLRQRRRCVLGVAVWVEHWLFGTFVGWNRLSDVPHDAADYLFGEISCGCWFAFEPFLMFEEMTKVNNRISGNRCWSRWHKDWLRKIRLLNEFKKYGRITWER